MKKKKILIALLMSLLLGSTSCNEKETCEMNHIETYFDDSESDFNTVFSSLTEEFSDGLSLFGDSYTEDDRIEYLFESLDEIKMIDNNRTRIALQNVVNDLDSIDGEPAGINTISYLLGICTERLDDDFGFFFKKDGVFCTLEYRDLGFTNGLDTRYYLETMKNHYSDFSACRTITLGTCKINKNRTDYVINDSYIIGDVDDQNLFIGINKMNDMYTINFFNGGNAINSVIDEEKAFNIINLMIENVKNGKSIVDFINDNDALLKETFGDDYDSFVDEIINQKKLINTI